MKIKREVRDFLLQEDGIGVIEVVLILVVRLGRGKLVAVLVFFIPVLTAVLEGAFPAAAPIWMLILAGGCYLTAAGAGGSDTGGAPGRGLCGLSDGDDHNADGESHDKDSRGSIFPD